MLVVRHGYDGSYAVRQPRVVSWPSGSVPPNAALRGTFPSNAVKVYGGTTGTGYKALHH